MNKHVSTKFYAMGGIFEVTVVGHAVGLVEKAEPFILNLEKYWSRFESSSDISRLNRAEGKPVSVSDETILLVSLMIEANRKTEGAYDPTILPALLEIGYSESHTGSGKLTVLPESAVWPATLEGTEIGHGIVKLPKGTTLDSGGIGKGLSADLLVSHLMESGAEGVLVSASGDVVVAGASVDGHSWKIGIEDPFNSDSEFEVVQINSGGVATSSSMKKQFGNKNHHLMFKTPDGTPENDVATVTVIASSGCNSETLTKVAFANSIEKSIELIEKLKGAALIIRKNGEVIRSPKWLDFLK
jgi:thiamine biosynthesis lipoprotein